MVSKPAEQGVWKEVASELNSKIEFCTITDPPDEMVSSLVARVREFNVAKSGLPPLRRVGWFLREKQSVADGKFEGIMGGGCAGLWGNSMHIDVLWVEERFRGLGLGNFLMVQAESFAKSEGCTFSYVETLSFQAKPFYSKKGYQEFGRLTNIANNHDLYFMRKDL